MSALSVTLSLRASCYCFDASSPDLAASKELRLESASQMELKLASLLGWGRALGLASKPALGLASATHPESDLVKRWVSELE
jgi:hypothetical protein